MNNNRPLSPNQTFNRLHSSDTCLPLVSWPILSASSDVRAWSRASLISISSIRNCESAPASVPSSIRMPSSSSWDTGWGGGCQSRLYPLHSPHRSSLPPDVRDVSREQAIRQAERAVMADKLFIRWVSLTMYRPRLKGLSRVLYALFTRADWISEYFCSFCKREIKFGSGRWKARCIITRQQRREQKFSCDLHVGMKNISIFNARLLN